MATPTKKDSGIDLLYPDLLSKEGLLHNLRKRYVRLSATDLETLDKEALVDLYNKYILPLPQRKYRDNRRGREMKKKQISRDKKRKFTLSSDDDSVAVIKKGRLTQDIPSGPSKGLVNNFTSNLATSRLKPPPSCIDSSKKVVKLGSSSSKSSSPSITPKQQEESKDLSDTKPVKKAIKFNSDKKSVNTAVKRPANDVSEILLIVNKLLMGILYLAAMPLFFVVIMSNLWREYKDEKSPKKVFKPIQWP